MSFSISCSLDVALTLSHEILQLTAGSLECVADGYMGVLLRARRRRLAADRDVANA